IKSFRGVDAREYAYIMHVLDKPGKDKPSYQVRLTYFPTGNKLIAVMPHNIHEAPFNMLQVEL
ncbi:hypothetical protein V8E55_010323, partial [Tylopilus felleus]